MIVMSSRLSWHEGHTDKVDHAEVTSADELDRVLDRLAARAAELGTPFNLTLAGAAGTSMDIVLGATMASVQWLRVDPWCCRVSVAEGVDDDDDLVQFAGNGPHSELPRRCWIEVPLAREAVRHYFHTGKLTPLVRWEQF